METFDEFAAWVRERAAEGSPTTAWPPIEPSTGLVDAVPDPLALARLFMVLELEVESPFPPELLEVISTFDDLYHFTMMKCGK